MPGDDRRIAPAACVVLVMLRLFIGWHLMYEGLWKLNTQKTPQPWTAEGYLKNATGPLRGYFRNMTGDPNDLTWTDYDVIAKRWDEWQARFLAHYPDTGKPGPNGKSVADQLNGAINGTKEFVVELAELPSEVKLDRWQKAIRFDADRKRLIVDGSYHLLASERDAILAMATLNEEADAAQQEVVKKFTEALNRLYLLQSRLSYKERLAAILKGDPERVGVLQKEKDGAIIEKRMGSTDQYRTLIERYETNLALAKTDYQWRHLEVQWAELQQLRRSLVGPVQALDAELKTRATEMLSPAQLLKGPVPEPMTPMRSIDLQTMWGLTILGVLLIAGLFTRLAALGATVLLMMFYLAAPPWPGTPPEVGIEHNYVVNKVLIEATACLAFVFLPTGRWFGIDALLSLLFYRRPRD